MKCTLKHRRTHRYNQITTLMLALIFQHFLSLTLYIRLPAVFHLLLTSDEKVHKHPRWTLLSHCCFQSHKNFPNRTYGPRARLKAVRHLKWIKVRRNLIDMQRQENLLKDFWNDCGVITVWTWMRAESDATNRGFPSVGGRRSAIYHKSESEREGGQFLT
jgi:hypothetical protein